jgi:hypothetical protein
MAKALKLGQSALDTGRAISPRLRPSAKAQTVSLVMTAAPWSAMQVPSVLFYIFISHIHQECRYHITYLSNLACCIGDPSHWQSHEADFADDIDSVRYHHHCDECMSDPIRELACKDEIVLTMGQAQNSTQATSPSKASELPIWLAILVSAASVRTASRTFVTRKDLPWDASSSSSTSMMSVTLGAPVPWPTGSLRAAGSVFHASSSKRPRLTAVVSRRTSSSGRRVRMDRGSSSELMFVSCVRCQTTADRYQEHLCDCGRVADAKYLVECRWCEEYMYTPEVSALFNSVW